MRDFQLALRSVIWLKSGKQLELESSRDGEMSRWVNYSMRKHEDLNLGSQHPHNKLEVGVHICNPSVGGMERGGEI